MENAVEKINTNDKIELAQNSSENIKNLIYTIRGKQVIIVIDNKELYHCGAPLKDLGKKCFAISKIEDMEYIQKIKLKVLLLL